MKKKKKYWFKNSQKRKTQMDKNFDSIKKSWATKVTQSKEHRHKGNITLKGEEYWSNLMKFNNYKQKRLIKKEKDTQWQGAHKDRE